MNELKVKQTHLETLVDSLESQIEERESTLNEIQEEIWKKEIELKLFNSIGLRDEAQKIVDELETLENQQTELRKNKLWKENSLIKAAEKMIAELDEHIDEDDD
ncbi:hypothetical protein [Paenibacillus alvei]|uniref:hypothetical protein n=1 Tax=Paenibacillus alvei TaxID=44250 RepID=UPI0018CF3E01|nr:hypothetical protein [Paenibacillus alvei]MBG9736531.1 hypothetical protein [Paenibacillus alvei]MBG9747155.1 hypothetical protein [Paenibacillus alvei]MCY9582450.1 hypothetical protein [Paenibacillus alvei]MCY9587354.1 hypothetical protein [Paenibacillus alvei]